MRTKYRWLILLSIGVLIMLGIMAASAADYPPPKLPADQRQRFFDLMDEYLVLVKSMAFRTDCPSADPVWQKIKALDDSIYRRFGKVQYTKEKKPVSLEDNIRLEAALAGMIFRTSCLKGYDEAEVKRGMKKYESAEEMMRAYADRALTKSK